MMNNPTTNLVVSVANLGVGNLDRMNNTSPSESSINYLTPKLGSVPPKNPPIWHIPDHIEHPSPEDRDLLIEPFPSNNPRPLFRIRGNPWEKVFQSPITLHTIGDTLGNPPPPWAYIPPLVGINQAWIHPLHHTPSKKEENIWNFFGYRVKKPIPPQHTPMGQGKRVEARHRYLPLMHTGKGGGR